MNDDEPTVSLQYRPGDPPTWLLKIGDGESIVTQTPHGLDLLCEEHGIPLALVDKAMHYPGVWWS